MALHFPLFVGVLTAAFVLPIGGGEWIQDMAKAKAKAKAEKKDLLIDFTGSDWCIWCKRLDGEVFSKDEFASEIEKHFVLVKLDYPRDKKLVTEEIAKQNEQLKADYQIEGYPTVFLTDSDGRPYAQTGYQEGGPAKYLEHVEGLRKKGEAFAAGMGAAAKAKGADRAKALDAALGQLDDELVAKHYGKEMAEILDLDKDGKAGLKAKYEERVRKAQTEKDLSDLQDKVNEMAGSQEWDKLGTFLDETIKAKKSPELAQGAMFFKGMVAIREKNDTAGGLKLLEEAKALAPKTKLAENIDSMIPRIKEAEAAKAKEGAGKKEEGKKEEPKKEGAK